MQEERERAEASKMDIAAPVKEEWGGEAEEWAPEPGAVAPAAVAAPAAIAAAPAGAAPAAFQVCFLCKTRGCSVWKLVNENLF